MRKIKILFFFTIITFGLFAQNKAKTTGVLFETGTLGQALEKAASGKKNVPKLVFVDCYTTWCGPCKYMTNSVFPKEDVGTFFNANFVNIKIDMENGEGPELGKKYRICAYPTFLILKPNGEEINRLVGGDEADIFIGRVKKAMDPSGSPKAKRAVYDRDKSFDNAVAYLEVLNTLYMHDEIKAFVEEIIGTLSSDDKYSETFWPYLSLTASNPESFVFDILIREKNIADIALTRERVDASIKRTLIDYSLRYVGEKLKNNTDSLLMKKIAYLSFVGGDDALVPIIMNVSLLYSKNKMDEISSYLKNQTPIILRSSEDSRRSAENLIYTIHGLPADFKDFYVRSKIDYFTKNIEYLKKSVPKEEK